MQGYSKAAPEQKSKEWLANSVGADNEPFLKHIRVCQESCWGQQEISVQGSPSNEEIGILQWQSQAAFQKKKQE